METPRALRDKPFERQESDLLTVIKPDQRTDINTAAEQLESRLQTNSAKKDPHPELLKFPTDDISVEKVPKKSKYAVPSISVSMEFSQLLFCN